MAPKTSRNIRSLPTDRTVDFPESDGKPMAETDFHRTPMMDLIAILEYRYQDRSDVYVSGNMFLHDNPAKPRKKPIAPDVFVVFGVEKKKRRSYRLWEEGKGPDFVLEIASQKTFRKDLGEKKDWYASVFGVKEYYLFDPDRRYLPSPLMGYRLREGSYTPISPVEGRLPSEVLGLELALVGDELKLYDPQKKEWVLKPEEEAEAKAQQAEAKAQQEAIARQQAEAKAQQEAKARQQAEAKAQQAETKAQQEAKARQQAEAKAQQEAIARQQAETELARLRAELERLRTASE